MATWRVVPEATETQLNSRFTEGAKIHGANLRRACIQHTWDEQKEAFARLVLVNTFAIYEGWIEKVLTDLGRNTKPLLKGLQFPEDPAGGGGVRTAITDITAIESPLKENFYAPLCSGRHYSFAHIDQLMLCYRFFKELVNCEMHGGGIADQGLVDAFNAFSAVASCAALGVSEVPNHHPAALDVKTRVSLRGVVGFSNIVLKLIATLDAELSRSQDAEKAFLAKWKLAHSHRLQLPANPGKRGVRIKRHSTEAGFPRPRQPGQLADWMKSKGLAFF